MAELVEGPRTGGFIVSEGNGAISREQVTLASGNGVLQPGTVLGKVTATSEFVPLDSVASDGSEVAAAILYAKKNTADEAQQATVVKTLAEVNGSLLIWPDGISDPQTIQALAELEAVFIITR
ncbi:MAG: head decoration protein [Sneathiella sp.]